MKQNVTQGIILNRINFGEADRIITVITPDFGKVRLMAKGVRRVKSKLAGGIELFSISSITYIPGKRDISTLVSTRLITYYSNIVGNLERTTLGYDALKLIDQTTENECETEFYELLAATLSALNQSDIAISLTRAWFYVQLLKLLGHEPNVQSDIEGKALKPGQNYAFDFEVMAFTKQSTGGFNESHIKILRLLLSQPVEALARVRQTEKVIDDLQPLLTAWQRESLQ